MAAEHSTALATTSGSGSREGSHPSLELDRYAGLKGEIGGIVRFCILGSADIEGADTEELVRAVATQVSGLEHGVIFITCGLSGVQEVFAKSCLDAKLVVNLVVAGSSSSYGVGRDVTAGETSNELEEAFSQVGDVYICFEGAVSVANEARAAAARGAGVVPLMRSGGASAGHHFFPAAALARPWFASEEQWALLGNKEVPPETSAIAVREILVAFLAARDAADEAAQHVDEDLDDMRWDTLAKLGEEGQIVPVAPGQMRFRGTFRGTAVTHTHQLDIDVGLDLEMPSQVAAEALRQMSARARTPEPPQLSDGRRQSLLGSLADFFRRDSQVGRQLPSIQLKLDDPEAWRIERDKLQLSLTNAQGEAGYLQDTVQHLSDEKDAMLKSQMQLKQDLAAQVALADELKQQRDSWRERTEKLAAELAQRDADAFGFQSQLSRVTAELEATRVELERERAAARQQDKVLAEARADAEGFSKQNLALKAEVGELQVRASSLGAKLQALEATRQQQRGEVDAKLLAAQKDAEERQITIESLRVKIAKAETEVAEKNSLKAKLETTEKELNSTQLKVAELQIRAAETLRDLQDRTAELEDARKELAEALARSTSFLPKAGSTDSTALDISRLTEQFQSLSKQQRAMQEEHEKVLRKLRQELEQAKGERSSALAAKAVLEAHASQTEASAGAVRKERDELRARSEQQAAQLEQGQVAAKVMSQELEQALKRLVASVPTDDVAELKASLAAEVKAAEEAREQFRKAMVAATQAQAEASEWKLRCHSAETREDEAQRTYRDLEVSNSRLALSEHAQRAKSVDNFRKDVEEAILGPASPREVRRGLDDALQREVQMKARVESLEGQVTQLLQQLRMQEPTVLLQDHQGAALIQPLMSAPPPVNSVWSQVVPPAPGPGRRIGRITHVGTSLGRVTAGPGALHTSPALAPAPSPMPSVTFTPMATPMVPMPTVQASYPVGTLTPQLGNRVTLPPGPVVMTSPAQVGFQSQRITMGSSFGPVYGSMNMRVMGVRVHQPV